VSRLGTAAYRDATTPAALRSAEDLTCKDINSLERMTLVDYARVNEGSITTSRVEGGRGGPREQKSLLPDVSALRHPVAGLGNKQIRRGGVCDQTASLKSYRSNSIQLSQAPQRGVPCCRPHSITADHSCAYVTGLCNSWLAPQRLQWGLGASEMICERGSHRAAED
jgi:hypothetical protein